MSSISSCVLRGFFATCVLMLAGCRPQAEAEATPERAQPKIAPSQRSLAPVEPKALQQATPAAVIGQMRARLRLAPDRRFLSALGRIDRFGGAPQPTAITASFAEGRWHVRAGQAEIGTLPELPTFADHYALLLARAQLVVKPQEPQAAAPRAADDAAFEIDHPLADLQAIDQSWDKSKPKAEDAMRAARAYAVLSVQLIDKLDVGDALFAQALAATAFAEAIAGRSPVREKALISRMMDYGQTASTLASELPAGDVVRSFVDYDVAAVVAQAKKHKDDGFSALLALRLLMIRAQTRDVEAFIAQAPDGLKGSAWALAQRAAAEWGSDGEFRSVLSALIAMREALGNPVEVPAAARYPGGGLREDADLKTVATALQVPFEQVIPQAERLLGMLGSAPGGVWLPADARVAFYRAQTFSALDSLVRFYVDRLSAPEAAKEVVAMLGNGESKLAQQFQRFANDIIRAERRTLPLDALVQDMRELGDLGLGALDRLWEPIRTQGFYNSAQLKAAVAIVERCDSRIDCQSLLTDIAYFSLNDLVTDEMLRRSVLAESPYAHGGLRLRSSRMERDRTGFLALLRDPHISVAMRAWHLQYGPEWLEPSEMRGAFEALVREAPTNFRVREYYVNWLREQKDDARSIQVLDEWLAQRKSDHVLDPILARTMRARALQYSGRAGDAWKEIEPLLPSMYGPTMQRAAYVKSAAGDAEAAVALAKRRLDRYSDSASVGLLAAMQWKANRPEEAAALLESWSNVSVRRVA